MSVWFCPFRRFEIGCLFPPTTPTDSVPPQLHNRRSLMVSLHLPDNLKLMDLSRHYLMDTAKVKAGDVDSSVDVSHLLEDSSSDEDDEIDD